MRQCFIISQPRAGSTLLQRLLATHPQIQTIGEPWLVIPFVYALREKGISAEYIHISLAQGFGEFVSRLPSGRAAYFQEVRAMLDASDRPYVIENVVGAPITTASDLFGRHGVTLCGTGFGLRVRRHRLFESNVDLVDKGCGDHQAILNPYNSAHRVRFPDPGEREWRVEMGVPWMKRYEAREAIPPAYTEYIGQQLLGAVAWT